LLVVDISVEGVFAGQKEMEEPMEEINKSWYIITDRGRKTYETNDKETAKTALRDGAEVSKVKRVVFHQGPTTLYLTATTDIYKIRDL